MTTNTEALHIVPINDLRERVASRDRWCNLPEEDQIDDVWIHPVMGWREEYEEGRKLT